MKSLSGKTTQHLKRNIIVAVVIVIVAGAGAFAYRAATTPPAKDTTPTVSKPDTKVNEKPATNDEKQAGQNQKQTIVDQDQDENQTATPSTIAVTLTAANQNGTVFNLRSLIGTVTSSGTCTLTLTKASATVTKTSGIQALADSSTCKGFDIPTSELSKGTWHALLNVTVGTAKGKAEQNIAVN
jgi:hypothetical protein